MGVFLKLSAIVLALCITKTVARYLLVEIGEELSAKPEKPKWWVECLKCLGEECTEELLYCIKKDKPNWKDVVKCTFMECVENAVKCLPKCLPKGDPALPAKRTSVPPPVPWPASKSGSRQFDRKMSRPRVYKQNGFRGGKWHETDEYTDEILPEYSSPEPVDCEWSKWETGRCSKTCGRGSRTNQRYKEVEQSDGGRRCRGRSYKVEKCNDGRCPVRGGWNGGGWRHHHGEDHGAGGWK